MKLKKEIKILIGVILGIIVLASLAVALYFYGLTPNSKIDETYIYIVEEDYDYQKIIDELYENDLIKSNLAGYVYLFLNKDLTLKVGTYEFNKNMSTDKIIEKIAAGETKNIKKITFIEGKRLTSYASLISQNFEYSEEEVLNKLKDKEFLNKLITNYWFITEEVLNDKLYYPLEGYLFPDTYNFDEDSSLEGIILTLIKNLGVKLEPFKGNILSSGLSVHQIITMASIVELEGVTKEDRANIASVFYNRINQNIPLGSDVTTYYGVQKDFSVELTVAEYNTCNDYNTRASCLIGLPVGPIASISSSALEAAVNPPTTDYLYFVADKNKKTYFTKNEVEHNQTITTLKEQGLWFIY